MQYLLLIYQDEKSTPKPQPEQMAEIMKPWFRLNDALKEAGAFIGADALQSVSTATTVRVRDGKATFTDGPFAETAEQLAGYYLIEAENLDEALKWAQEIPAIHHGAVEVRPIMMLPKQPE